MVLNVKNVFKLQADHETFLQLDVVEAFRALRVGVGVVRTGDHAGSLGKEVVTALHCGKQQRKWHTTITATATLVYLYNSSNVLMR